MSRKLMIITGAGRGIGAATAVLAARMLHNKQARRRNLLKWRLKNLRGFMVFKCSQSGRIGFTRSRTPQVFCGVTLTGLTDSDHFKQNIRRGAVYS